VLILESAAATALVAGSVFILRACWRGDHPKLRLAARNRTRTRTARAPRRLDPRPGLHKHAA